MLCHSPRNAQLEYGKDIRAGSVPVDDRAGVEDLVVVDVGEGQLGEGRVVGRGEPLLQELLPLELQVIDVGEVADLQRVLHALGRVLQEQAAEQESLVLALDDLQVQLLADDRFIDADGIGFGGAEGEDAGHHLVEDDAHRPDVGAVGVGGLLDDFGGHVEGRADECGGAVGGVESLGAAEVDEHEFAVVLDDDVVGVEVAVEDVLGVEVVEGVGDGGEEVLGDLVGHLAEAADDVLQLAADDVLEEQVVVVLVLLRLVVPADVVVAQTRDQLLLPPDHLLLQQHLPALHVLAVVAVDHLQRGLVLQQALSDVGGQFVGVADHLVGLEAVVLCRFVEAVVADGVVLDLLLVDLDDEFVAELHVLHDEHDRVVARGQLLRELAQIAQGQRQVHVEGLLEQLDLDLVGVGRLVEGQHLPQLVDEGVGVVAVVGEDDVVGDDLVLVLLVDQFGAVDLEFPALVDLDLEGDEDVLGPRALLGQDRVLLALLDVEQLQQVVEVHVRQRVDELVPVQRPLLLVEEDDAADVVPQAHLHRTQPDRVHLRALLVGQRLAHPLALVGVVEQLEEGGLPEVVALLHDDVLLAVDLDEDGVAPDDVEGVGVLLLLEEGLAGVELEELRAVDEELALLVGEVVEEVDAVEHAVDVLLVVLHPRLHHRHHLLLADREHRDLPSDHPDRLAAGGVEADRVVPEVLPLAHRLHDRAVDLHADAARADEEHVRGDVVLPVDVPPAAVHPLLEVGQALAALLVRQGAQQAMRLHDPADSSAVLLVHRQLLDAEGVLVREEGIFVLGLLQLLGGGRRAAHVLQTIIISMTQLSRRVVEQAVRISIEGDARHAFHRQLFIRVLLQLLHHLQHALVLPLLGGLDQLQLLLQLPPVVVQVLQLGEESHAQLHEGGPVHAFEVDLVLPPAYLIDLVGDLVLLLLAGDEQLLDELALVAQVGDLLLVVVRLHHPRLVVVDQCADVVPQGLLLGLVRQLVGLQLQVCGLHEGALHLGLPLEQVEGAAELGDLEVQAAEQLLGDVEAGELGVVQPDGLEVFGEGVEGAVAVVEEGDDLDDEALDGAVDELELGLQAHVAVELLLQLGLEKLQVVAETAVPVLEGTQLALRRLHPLQQIQDFQILLLQQLRVPHRLLIALPLLSAVCFFGTQRRGGAGFGQKAKFLLGG